MSEKENGQEGFYLVYSLEEVKESEFTGRIWDISRLSGYVGGRGSAIPFVVSLSELMGTNSSNNE